MFLVRGLEGSQPAPQGCTSVQTLKRWVLGVVVANLGTLLGYKVSKLLAPGKGMHSMKVGAGPERRPVSVVCTGTHCENTLPALEDLIRRDNAGELAPGSLVYVEFDVHVSGHPFRSPPVTSTWMAEDAHMTLCW